MRRVVLCLVNVVAVVGLYIFMGNSGVLNFSSVGFMAIGAYVAALLTMPTATKGMFLPDLPGRVVVVTGAGSGVGRGIALGLGALGAHVCGMDCDPSSLAETATLAKDQNFQAVTCDVAIETEVEAAFAKVLATAGRVGVVFANAGIAGHPKGIDSLDLGHTRHKGDT